MQNQLLRRLGIGLTSLAIFGFCASTPDSPSPKGEPPKPDTSLKLPEVAIYDRDPHHLWNRLYATLYVRTGKDGKEYGNDELDPFLWPDSKYLLTEPRFRQVIAVLDEFKGKNGAKPIGDPLKKAMFQRDLWAIFDWLADAEAEHQTEKSHRRELRKRLARIIGQVALSAEGIRGLPDNYAVALGGKIFPPKHDPSDPQKAFLPPDLLATDGPWVLLGVRGVLLTAPSHMQFFGGRSAFFVLMNLPQGRKATLDYLQKLRSFPNPLMPRPADRGGPGPPLPILNPDLPQFPVGTQVALVREMMLIDNQGTITPTRLVEDIQFRVFRDIPTKVNVPLERFDDLYSNQDFYEFQLRRKDLFSERAGGLHPVQPQEEESAYHLFLGSLAVVRDPLEAPAAQRSSGRSVILRSCTHCHGGPHVSGGPGIHSLRSYRRDFSQPPDLVDASRRWEEEAAVRSKRQHYSWGLLQGLLE
jgi:hypothetical protein